MKDSGCLARSALRADVHLACVSGPDVGVVLASGTVGRAGNVPLTCASVAREHLRLSTRDGRAVLRVSPGASPVRVRSRLPLWRHYRDGRPLAVGGRIRLGDDVFEVRARPRRLAWPSPSKRGRGSITGSSFLRGAPLISVLVMGGFLLWRLRSSVSLPSVLAPFVAGIASIAVLVAGALAWRVRRRRRGWDGSALSLVLAGLPASSAPPRVVRAAVWPGRPTRVGRRVYLAASADAREPGECEAIGIVGAHASQCALWCAGQIAAQLGGARVWWTSAAPVLIGHAGVDIHVSDRDSCPHCAGEATRPTFHVGYASSLSLLPAWCAQVCATDDEPVSSHWWWTVTRADAQDSLPRRLDWTPSSARGRGGGLGVRIGLGEEGPIDLDLVADGPHALVAGCTGSGKSEALLGWLASIAHCYSPERARFILIDYKGGATFARLEALPHTQALLTDLDAGATSRALDGIASILQRREETLGTLGFPDLATWESAHEEDPLSVTAPPPRLVVAIDEFRVLAQAHPDSMEVLLRLAAQGRSLGLHLIAATQRPSGAVSAQMRANMDIRLCLRCVSASDSTDILGDGRAASLPRIPGRAILADVGTIQLAYLADIASVVARCNATWPRTGTEPLWAPPLPEALSWEDVDAASQRFVGHAPEGNAVRGGLPGGTAVSLGLSEGIERHSPIIWDGGSIQIQTSTHEAHIAAQWALSLATRIAHRTRRPLHVVGEETVNCAASQLPVDAPGVVDLLEGICDHGPAVLALTDAPQLRSYLSQVLAAPQAEGLWTSLLAKARRADVVIVAAFAGRFTPPSAALGAFSTRIVRARDADEAVHAGIAPGELRALGEAQALLVRPGENPRLACIPRQAVRGRGDHLVGEGDWHIPSPSQVAALVRNAGSPILIGPTYSAPTWAHSLPWIIIGRRDDTRVVEAIHAHLGWETPQISDVIPEEAWTRITRWDKHRVLALNPTHNVIRALIQHSHTPPLALTARRWESTCGVISEGDTVTTVQLTVGSVNT